MGAAAQKRESMCRVALKVSGLVQGVGFRMFARECAMERGVSGWVRNESDGSVAAEAQGPREMVESFCAALQQGPMPGLVKEVRRTEIPLLKAEHGFRILI